VGAITFRNAKYWIDPEKCISCGSCVAVCHNGCISDPENPEPPAPAHELTKLQCDVCVVGAGGSGMVAAAKALDQGLSVILLEKNHEVGGSAWYAGGYRIHWSKLHAANGAKDERAKEYENFIRMVDGNVDKDLLARMFEANAEFVDWMVDEHGYLEDYDFVIGPRGGMFRAKKPWERAAKRIDKMIGPGEAGWYITSHLRDDFLKRGGTILYKTSGKKLLMDDSGACVGLLAQDPGGEVEIHAKSVVLATGAITRNKELMAKFQPLFYDDEGKEPVHIFTGSGCTGDGVTMCIEIGADIDYENRRVNMFGPMRHPYPCVSLNICMSGSGVTFGSQGNLYEGSMGMTEVSPLAFDPKRYCWCVVDDAIAQAAIDRAMGQPPQSLEMDLPAFLKNWREVLVEEEKAESLVSAPTLEELCQKLGFDWDTFKAGIDQYNESTKNPVALPPDMDPMFARPAPKPVAQGPFYAFKLKLFHEDAVGGMTINKNASVLKNGVPVPGLYAAGDTTRGIMVPGEVGVNYIENVFSCLTQAFNEGYIAGEEAAAYAKTV
jgi:fumarate reductase flavoprotein subunit